MSNSLDVTLDKSTTPWCLDIDQKSGANHVSRSSSAQTITWQVTGNAASGSFDARSDAEPGFAWVGAAPPAGIFGSPVLQANGNQLTMSDLDNGAGTTGDGIYQLSATIGDVVYQPNKTSPTGTHTNPSIKNN
jgi:hypothetical protein